MAGGVLPNHLGHFDLVPHPVATDIDPAREGVLGGHGESQRPEDRQVQGLLDW
jgi:hypothetical protein